MTKYLSLPLVIASLHLAPAHAQEPLQAPAGPHGFLALGPGLVPAFDGAEKHDLVPLALADVSWHGVELEVRGLGAKLDLLGESRLQLGPLVNYRGERDSSKDGSGRVRRLDDVDASLELGGHLGYRMGGDETGQGELAFDLSLAKAVADGHDGLLGTAQLSYAAYRSRKLFVSVDAQTTFADQEYMRAFFGVTRAEAARSGLDAYRPDGGIRDAGAGITAGYQFTERWGVIARAGASYYLGDARDSPVVEEGSKLQTVGGLALSFRF